MQLNEGTPLPEKLTETDTLIRDIDDAIASLSEERNNTPRMMLANRLRRSRKHVQWLLDQERKTVEV